MDAAAVNLLLLLLLPRFCQSIVIDYVMWILFSAERERGEICRLLFPFLLFLFQEQTHTRKHCKHLKVGSSLSLSSIALNLQLQ